MKTPGLFVTHVRRLMLPKRAQQKIYIIPFGDVHFKAPMFASNDWKEFCNRYKKRTDCYFIGMGDRQISNWETSERPLSKRNALAAKAAIQEILRRRGV